MQILDTGLQGLKIIEPTVYGDERGFFFESFNQRQFNEAIGQEISFVQDNHSRSGLGVLRGLHYQRPPHQQGKLVRVVHGDVFDVAVDIRADSPTCGQWHGERLSACNKRQLWIPAGFAHGFLVLSDSAEFLYKTTDFWYPELEASIRWDDPILAIEWPTISADYLMSGKDMQAMAFSHYMQTPALQAKAP